MKKLSVNYDPDLPAFIYHGSCFDFTKRLPAESVQLVITSPPYNIGKEYEKKINLEEYCQSQAKIIAECVRVLKKEGSLCWQVGNFVDHSEILPLDILLFPIFQRHKLKLRNRIVWHFGHGLHASKRFSGRYETILWFTKSDHYTFNLDAVRIPQKYPQKKHFKGPRQGESLWQSTGQKP